MPLNVTSERMKRRISSDASIPEFDGIDQPPTVDLLFDCMKNSPRWAPKAIRMNVCGEFVGTDEERVVAILVVPTAVHTVYDYYPADHPRREEHQKVEYEFEGWLLGDYPEKIWVIGSLLYDGTIVLTRLEPGEEIGTQFSGLAWPKNS